MKLENLNNSKNVCRTLILRPIKKFEYVWKEKKILEVF